MTYQDCSAPAQAPDEPAAGAARPCDASINPDTGLATDYLNHFNEAIMLLDMLPDCPDGLDDFLAWRPMSYCEHFAKSRFKGRDLAIAAYNAAEPGLREFLDALAVTMTVVLETTRTAICANPSSTESGLVAAHAVTCLKPLIARAAAVINGDLDPEGHDTAAIQSVIDGLMQRPIP
jgi:hypothetical protein